MNNDVGQSAAKCAVAGEPRGHGHGFFRKKWKMKILQFFKYLGFSFTSGVDIGRRS